VAALGAAVHEAGEQRQPSTLFRVLRRPGMMGGMLATILIFSGHFAFFTYLRPFLEPWGRRVSRPFR
jgi:predicted MFS family arabinose efflux permease